VDAVDPWHTHDLSGNGFDGLMDSMRRHGVADCATSIVDDMRALPFCDDRFDGGVSHLRSISLPAPRAWAGSDEDRACRRGATGF